jgi:hypothetical protein
VSPEIEGLAATDSWTLGPFSRSTGSSSNSPRFVRICQT